ncbi:RWD domain-containing protein 2A [Lutzomyia longipalpis]|uniref:RWD domain-containing protein n=1 Tax=Lutzomyia longipalpis TaxID=7200 RepID=A0A1B0GK23_LUTLO|nr:RWD domain-containing protein 2A [Lutzomyia longipalpis]
MDEVINIQNDLLRSCLSQQIDELSMLESIFCNPGEFHIDDHSIAADINEFLENRLDAVQRKLDFRICLQLDEGKMYLSFELPHFYPSVEIPRISVDSTKLTKKQEIAIGRKIEDYIKGLDKSEPYIYQIVSWLQDNVDDLRVSATNDAATEKDEKVIFERMWIYSHHIKSKTKRKDIVKNAHDLSLTGFSLPGKPGVICVEGEQRDTQEFWQLLRQMHWQKITLKQCEETEVLKRDFDDQRRFTDFKEILFVDVGDDEEVVLNMSNFIKFLELHNCGYIKKELFGFD